MSANLDLTTVAGISAAAMFFLSTIKALFPKKVEGKEPIIAVIIGLSLAVAAHLGKTIEFKPGIEGWIQTIAVGLGVAVGAQGGHDYVLNPVKEFLGGLFSKVKSFFKKDDGKDAPQ